MVIRPRGFGRSSTAGASIRYAPILLPLPNLVIPAPEPATGVEAGGLAESIHQTFSETLTVQFVVVYPGDEVEA